MSEGVAVTSWAKVSDDAPMRFVVNDGECTLDLLIGTPLDGVELVFTPAALDRLITLGRDALANRLT